jgi:hypothetical protein
MINLCGPAIIYLIFSLTQIIIDLFKGLYNTAIMKTIVMAMVTLLLNILCEKGLSVVSWIIVFIPFIMMTVIVSMLLYIFGLDASTGSLNYTCNNSNANTNTNTNGVTVDALGNVIIYDPEYNAVQIQFIINRQTLLFRIHQIMTIRSKIRFIIHHLLIRDQVVRLTKVKPKF